MAVFNYGKKEIDAKIVYCGPGISGKTTSLQFIYQHLKADQRGQMISLATNEDRTLFFDFLPIELESVRGFKTRFHLYTVPGQVYYSGTRRAVLTGADGVIFVADSHGDRMEDNLASFRDLEEHLRYYGKKIETIPLVIQYNKRDLPGALSIEVLNQKLNPLGSPYFEAVAITGKGVFDSLTMICRLVLTAIENGVPGPSENRASFSPPGEMNRAVITATSKELPPSRLEGIYPPPAEKLQPEKPLAPPETTAPRIQGALGKPAPKEKERIPLRRGSPVLAVLDKPNFQAQKEDKALASGDRIGLHKGLYPANVASFGERPSLQCESVEKEKKPSNPAVHDHGLGLKTFSLKVEKPGGKKDPNIKSGVRIVSCGRPRVSSPTILEIPLDLTFETADKSFPFKINISIDLETNCPG